MSLNFADVIYQSRYARDGVQIVGVARIEALASSGGVIETILG
jgi:hypothetical protein